MVERTHEFSVLKNRFLIIFLFRSFYMRVLRQFKRSVLWNAISQHLSVFLSLFEWDVSLKFLTNSELMQNSTYNSWWHIFDFFYLGNLDQRLYCSVLFFFFWAEISFVFPFQQSDCDRFFCVRSRKRFEQITKKLVAYELAKNRCVSFYNIKINFEKTCRNN